MEILHRDDGKKGMFYIEQDGDVLASLVYTWAGQTKFIIEHTEVGEALEGRGIGKQLVQQAVQMAREKNIHIIPLCPFAKKVFDREASYADVLFHP